MKSKIISSFLIILFSVLSLNASIIEVESWINPVSQPKIGNDQYLLVEFWATWCGPCKIAIDHLNELQKAVGDRVVLISMTKEKEAVVKHYFRNKPFKSFIATDYNGRTFDKFSVTAIPYSILIAPDGEIIWKGLPSGLTADKLKKLMSKNKLKSLNGNDRISTFETIDEIKPNSVTKTVKDGALESNFNVTENFIPFYKNINCKKNEISGSIDEIISELINIPNSNITKSYKTPIFGYFSFNDCLNQDNKALVINHLLELSKVRLDSQTVAREIYSIKIKDKELLWSNELFEWSDDSSSSTLFDNEMLEADNYTITDISLVISNLLGKEIQFTGLDDTVTHDWNLNLSSFESLKLQLEKEYGLIMVKENIIRKQYFIKDR